MSRVPLRGGPARVGLSARSCEVTRRNPERGNLIGRKSTERREFNEKFMHRDNNRNERSARGTPVLIDDTNIYPIPVTVYSLNG